MLTVRPHQSTMFAKMASDRFVEAMLAHLREHLPERVAFLGEEGALEAIHFGVHRAGSYGIESEPGVRVFVQLMFVFGPDFDLDSELPWASRCLRAPQDERARVSALVAAADGHLRARAATKRSVG